jgi:hypothetical protein
MGRTATTTATRPFFSLRRSYFKLFTLALVIGGKALGFPMAGPIHPSSSAHTVFRTAPPAGHTRPQTAGREFVIFYNADGFQELTSRIALMNADIDTTGQPSRWWTLALKAA